MESHTAFTPDANLSTPPKSESNLDFEWGVRQAYQRYTRVVYKRTGAYQRYKHVVYKRTGPKRGESRKSSKAATGRDSIPKGRLRQDADVQEGDWGPQNQITAYRASSGKPSGERVSWRVEARSTTNSMIEDILDSILSSKTLPRSSLSKQRARAQISPPSQEFKSEQEVKG